MTELYFDHAATTPVHPEVVRVIRDALETEFGNPSSIHRFGRKAHADLTQARQTIAATLGAHEDEILFTSGGTEGDNMAIIQTARYRAKKGKHLITTAVEHHAVLHAMAYLETEGYEVTYLPVNEAGIVTVAQVAEALRPDTTLVSIMAVNNETGVHFPLAEIGTLLQEHQAWFHSDAVQLLPLGPIDVNTLQVDLLTVTAHKINGPKGIGALYIRTGIQLPAWFHGGEQEAKRRPGTENVPSIMGFAKACELLATPAFSEQRLLLGSFIQQILNRLNTEGVSYVVNGEQAERSEHVLNLWLKGIPNDLLLLNLDLAGIALSTGSACTAGNVEPSHVLMAMYGPDSPAIHESVRISIGTTTSQAAITQFLTEFLKVIQRLAK